MVHRLLVLLLLPRGLPRCVLLVGDLAGGELVFVRDSDGGDQADRGDDEGERGEGERERGGGLIFLYLS